MKLSQSAATKGLIALVLLNIVLVALALRPRPEPDVTITSRGQTAPPSSPAPGTSPASPQSAPSSGTIDPVPLTVLVSASSADVGWRVTSGTCSSPGPAQAVVESSKDGGRSWRRSAFPDPVAVRVKATSSSRAFTISASSGADGCRPAYRSTRDAQSWSGASDPANAWFRSPSDAKRVGVPGGRTSRPCGPADDVVDLVVDSAVQAAALCSNERAVRTTDGGQSWQFVATVPGAVAITADPGGSGYAVAALGASACDGVAVLTVTNSPKRLGCIAGVPEGAVAGKVAISTAADAVWVVAGSTVYVSTDRAVTFDRRT